MESSEKPDSGAYYSLVSRVTLSLHSTELSAAEGTKILI